MMQFELSAADDFDGWRAAARRAMAAGLADDQVLFLVAGDNRPLFDGLLNEDVSGQRDQGEIPEIRVPKEFPPLAKQVICHADPGRFSLLYRILCRLGDDRFLMRKPTDPDVHRANILAKEVRRDAHKMKAFVRFRKVGNENQGSEKFVAWFEPDHHIVRLTAPFFMRRFTGMNWSILTPKGCAHWDGHTLNHSPAIEKPEGMEPDVLEDYWRSYYASIFNPARLKISAMTSEMPKKYWKNLPEAELIPALTRSAQRWEVGMIERDPTVPKPQMMEHKQPSYLRPEARRQNIESLSALNEALKNCRNCPLWKPATQTVCGAGPTRAELMLVGEQPGDQEDIQGKPFVGPAGQLLKGVISDVGVSDYYTTNAVKHFKFEPRGKRRIHKSPSTAEIDHCRWWLQKEIELVKPRAIVALGRSAVRGVTGKTGKISEMAGRVWATDEGVPIIVTRHPSSILRISDHDEQKAAHEELRTDLEMAWQLVSQR
ncbi:MAG: UdgX family uracil-DNA binding protein [Pseudomonadota bacterium]